MRQFAFKILKVLALLLLCAPGLQAESIFHAHKFGLGLNLGSPNGVSAKYWIDRENAIDMAVGGNGYYLGSYYSGIDLHVDYLWHFYGVFGSPRSQAYEHLPIYLGVGGMYSNPAVADDRGVLVPQGVAGVRIVGGLTWIFRNAPFDVYADAAPTFVVAPGSGFVIDPEIGGRFYF